MEGDQQPDEGPGEGLGFDLLDDGIDSLSAAVLDCMPSPPDSAALYRQLGISTDGTDNLGLDLGAGGDYGLGVPVPDTPSSFLGDPAPSATLDLFPMPGGAGVKTEGTGGDVHRRGADESTQTAEKSNKKHAPLGQWQTPPQLQFYGSNLKKNKSELDVPSAGARGPVGVASGSASSGGPEAATMFTGQLGSSAPGPATLPFPPPSSAPPMAATTFPANFRPPPPGTLPRSVSFEGLTTAGTPYPAYMPPMMMPYHPGFVPMQGGGMGLPGFPAAQAMPMFPVLTPEQQQEALSRMRDQKSMPPPPAKSDMHRREDGAEGGGEPMMGVAPHHVTDLGTLRRQPFSCPDLTKMAAREPPMMAATAAESMATTSTTESSSAASSAPFPPFPPPMPDYTTLQAQGLLSTLLTDDMRASLRGPMHPSSCPDFQHLPPGSVRGGAGSEDEDRRQKRLARNRAAARLRRQRKKNLVETYEAEVTALEANLKKLQSHEWGGDKEAEAGSVEEALGRAKVLELMPLERARETADAVLQQQMRMLQALSDDVDTIDVMAAMLSTDLTMSEGSEEGQTLAALRAEMFRELELTDEQGAQLRSLLGTDPCRAEREALSAAEKGLQELGSRKAEDCLRDADLCQSLVRTGLEKAQLRRFMAWADANRDSIDQLPYSEPGGHMMGQDGTGVSISDAPDGVSSLAAWPSSASSTSMEQGPGVSAAEALGPALFHFFGEGQ